MKKIIILLTVFLGVAAFQSCSLDNFDGPDTTLTGALVDSETNESLPSQYQNGAWIRLYEFYNGDWVTQPNNFYVKQDGTFTNKAIFAGKYKIKAEGPFEDVTEIEMDLTGTKDLQVKVVPFLRVTANAAANGTSVTINGKISRTSSSNAIQRIAFCCNTTPYVDKNTFMKDGFQEVDLSSMTDAEILSQTFTQTFSGLKSGITYYVRVGALAQNASSFYNYSTVIEVKIP